MDKIFAQLQKKHQAEPYLPISQRQKMLKALRSLLQENAHEIAEAVSKDFTYRSQEETMFLEILPTVTTIQYCLKHMKKWAEPRKRHVPWYFSTAKAYVFPQPLGVVGIIVPWNYPLYLSMVPAVFALAAGNRLMIKMSELSPHLGKLLYKLIKNCSELNEMVAIINGDISTGKEFSQLPFGHILFTGSIQVGKLIMQSASKNLTPVTLELGGKSPVLVSESANSDLFERIFMGKMFNAGQTCLASDYLLIHEKWEDQMELRFRQFIDKRYPNLLDNDCYTSIISKENKARLENLLDDAREKGGRIVSYGEEAKGRSNKMPVYLVFNANKSMKLMQSEIFGPILPIMTYKTFDKAVEWINSLTKPLALYYFGDNEKEKDILIEEVLSGATTINDTMMHVAIHDLPFGGVEASGMGQYHGQEGFDSFSKLKPVFEQSKRSFVSMMYPPYHAIVRRFLYRLAGIKHKKGD